MATQRQTHVDIARYAVCQTRRSGRIDRFWAVARRNRLLCAKHGHDWRSVRSEVISDLRRVDAARKGVAA